VKGTCIGPSGSYYSRAIACTEQRDCGINLFLTVETVKATKAHTCLLSLT
jgi:hypothetical protein